eukprot:CAMPEP_0201509220 /NCGR_PEP_ID=MMETSP0161_2-20130828/2345_1 /ASSEMBLY_ACC=CAM_ASM_000251 /TAXON_ID=180227 /ORGANISM="Neoparamoeba aestuarina, Strain SoJaBio B1-5/56/2" /LENGTH=69 /DNA_ID=CAMNT_0047904117 /DNA_START=284 /DNA_END=490 /DNA_ORIENTATION=-
MSEYDPFKPNLFASLHDALPMNSAGQQTSVDNRSQDTFRLSTEENKRQKRTGNAGAKIFSMMLDTMENE